MNSKNKFNSIISVIIIGIIFFMLYIFSESQFSLYASSNNVENHILLTFDDGPNPKYTTDILNILQQHDVKGMFFVVGQEVKKYPEIVMNIHNKGHIIANHTHSHNIIKGMNKEELVNEIKETDNAIYDLVGYKPEYFRPPTGVYSQVEGDVLNTIGKRVLMWDFGLEKRKINTSDGLVEHILKRIRKSNKEEVILLLHDGNVRNKYDRTLTVKALPKLIKSLKDDGYIFINPSSEKGKAIIESFIKSNPKFNVY